MDEGVDCLFFVKDAGDGIRKKLQRQRMSGGEDENSNTLQIFAPKQIIQARLEGVLCIYSTSPF